MAIKGNIEGQAIQGDINRLYELRGYSAYEVAVLNGYVGTKEEWLASLKGDPGQVIHTDADGAVLDDVFAKKSPLYKAGVGNVTEVISNAEAGATVQLEPGDYPLLTFTGEYGLARAETKKPLPGNVMRYPENLTIVGGVGVTVAGISLTSGVYEDFWNCDNSNAVLPKGLTLKDLKVSVGISLRNGIVDNLSIINCHITSGSIYIAPNRYKDQFGSEEYSPSNQQHRPNNALPPVKNLLIRDCTIENAYHETIGELKSAIYVQCANNATIENNTINRAEFNGVQVVSIDSSITTGKIAISDNTINYSGSRSIRVANLSDATLWVVSNKLYNANQLEENGEYIKVSGCEYTSYFWNMENPDTYNRYDGEVISVSNGISVSSAKEDYVVKQGTSGIWAYRKWASGIAECWLRISSNDGCDGLITPSVLSHVLGGGTFHVANTAYPFQFMAPPNVVSSVEIDGDPAVSGMSHSKTTLVLNAFSLFVDYECTIKADIYVFGRYK